MMLCYGFGHNLSYLKILQDTCLVNLIEDNLKFSQITDHEGSYSQCLLMDNGPISFLISMIFNWAKPFEFTSLNENMCKASKLLASYQMLNDTSL